MGEPDASVPRIARAILYLALGAASLALLYYVLTFEQRWGGPLALLRYYLLPAAAVVGIAFALRASSKTQRIISLMLVIAALPLYAVEAALGYARATRTPYGLSVAVADSACPQTNTERWMCLTFVGATGGPFDARTRMQVVEDLAAEGREAWPSLDGVSALSNDPPSLDGQPFAPIAPGVSRALTVFCNELGEWGLYESDEFGFRNVQGGHAPGGVEIVVVGDSFAHGACTTADSDIMKVLLEKVPTALSLGSESTGPLTQLGAVREYAAPLRPPAVVWLFFEGDDLTNLLDESQHDIIRRYLEPGFEQGLRSKQERLDPILKEWVTRVRLEQERTRVERVRARDESARRLSNRPFVRWIRLRELRTRLAEWRRGDPVREHPWDEELFRDVLATARRDVRGWGGEILFVYLPSLTRIAGEPGTNPHRREILSTVRDLGIPTVDIVPAFVDHADPLSLFPYRVTHHYTEEGNRLVVDRVLTALSELGLR